MCLLNAIYFKLKYFTLHDTPSTSLVLTCYVSLGSYRKLCAVLCSLKWNESSVSLCQIEQYSFYFNAKKRVDYKFTKERNLKTINSRFKLGSFTEEKKLRTI